MVIPTLAADARLQECVESLRRQTRRDFEVIIVDNSGQGLVRRNGAAPGARVIENSRNAGFGAAMNQGLRASGAPYLAALNDDAVPHPGWLDALVTALDRRPDAGMCASQVRLFGEDRLDSAGMLVARDGSSKQRGHGKLPADFPEAEETLFPSGSAALYRRAMLEETGGFDDRFFLYCEDTDLGLRARWKAWECVYVPEAVVEHRYSHSSAKASALKAYFVERNRILVVIRNFPVRALLITPFHVVTRYFWHWNLKRKGKGIAASYEGDEAIASILFRAWRDALKRLPAAWRKRRQIQSGARLSKKQFQKLLKLYRISSREVASQ